MVSYCQEIIIAKLVTLMEQFFLTVSLILAIVIFLILQAKTNVSLSIVNIRYENQLRRS